MSWAFCALLGAPILFRFPSGTLFIIFLLLAIEYVYPAFGFQVLFPTSALILDLPLVLLYFVFLRVNLIFFRMRLVPLACFIRVHFPVALVLLDQLAVVLFLLLQQGFELHELCFVFPEFDLDLVVVGLGLLGLSLTVRE